MAEFPDLLINPNPNAPSLDLSANQVRGLGFFNTTGDRDSLNINVRVLGHLAVIKSSDEVYQYTGADTGNAAWTDTANWQLIGAAPDAGVSSLNSLTGAVNITAGTNVTINVAGRDIEISASGGGAVDDVNGETGSVTLVAGTGIGVNAQAGTGNIEISSTGVDDVNGETGIITLVAGTGIDIDPQAGTGNIEISATGGGTEGQELALVLRDTAYGSTGDHEGTTLLNNNNALVAGSVYYWNGGTYVAANASAASSASGLLVLATSPTPTVPVLKTGIMQLTTVPGSAGDVLYLAKSNGQLTNDISAFAQGDIVRVCGYNLDGNKVYFDPSSDWIELA